MIKTHLLTKTGFKSLEDYLATKRIIKSSTPYIFYGSLLNLATGLKLIYPVGFNLRGLVSKEFLISNELSNKEVSLYKPDDFIYTSFNTKIEVTKPQLNIDILKESSFESMIDNLKNKVEPETSLESISSNLILDESFYKFIGISLIRGKLTSFKDVNLIAYKFSKNKPLHLEMKKDLISFFTKSGIHFEISEYNKYYYVNFIDKSLSSIVKSFNESSETFKHIFNNFNPKFFIEYLYSISNNNYHLNKDTFLFLKEIAYNGRLVLTLKENLSSSSEKYAFISELNIDMESLDPPVIYLEDGYLTRIVSNKPINIKDECLNSIHLPNHLIIC